jgi:hypothetical protein
MDPRTGLQDDEEPDRLSEGLLAAAPLGPASCHATGLQFYIHNTREAHWSEGGRSCKALNISFAPYSVGLSQDSPVHPARFWDSP